MNSHHNNTAKFSSLLTLLTCSIFMSTVLAWLSCVFFILETLWIFCNSAMCTPSSWDLVFFKAS